MVSRNIPLAYVLTAAKHSWFWLGIWVFYYLRFTNYSGIGLIETVLIMTLTVMEIPTGAIADLLGKRKALILAFIFEVIGGIMMAAAPNFAILIASVFVMCVGGALYSGTLDALVYDSLKEAKKESSFDHAISTINAITLVTIAVSGAIGGFLYAISPRLPFYANAVGYAIGFVASFFLVEPAIDTVKFSFPNFVKQTLQGFRQLTKSFEVKRQTILLLTIGVFVVIADEMFDGFLGVEFGFSEKQLGLLFSTIYLVAAATSRLTPTLIKRLGNNRSIFLIGIVSALTFLVSPLLGIVSGGTILILRNIFFTQFNNLSSIAINDVTESKFRATTISTFNMMKNIPYALSAFLLGSLADAMSARMLTLWLGIILTVFLMGQMLLGNKKQITLSTGRL